MTHIRWMKTTMPLARVGPPIKGLVEHLVLEGRATAPFVVTGVAVDGERVVEAGAPETERGHRYTGRFVVRTDGTTVETSVAHLPRLAAGDTLRVALVGAFTPEDDALCGTAGGLRPVAVEPDSSAREAPLRSALYEVQARLTTLWLPGEPPPSARQLDVLHRINVVIDAATIPGYDTSPVTAAWDEREAIIAALQARLAAMERESKP